MKDRMIIFKLIVSFVFILFSVTFSISQTSEDIEFATEFEIKADIALVPCANSERLEGVRKLFLSKGADEKDIKIEDFKFVKNLVIEKPGKTKGTIIIGAHYDEAGGGCGAIDNWTGIVIIANLYKTLKDIELHKTVKFVAFGREEDGLIGSKAMAGAIPRSERAKHCAMVNFDSFGLAYPQVNRKISDSKLIDLAVETAERMDLPFSDKRFKQGISDSVSFRNKKIPALGIHGLNNRWRHYLHSPPDQVKNVNLASVYHGYLFSINILKAIDAENCGAFR